MSIANMTEQLQSLAATITRSYNHSQLQSLAAAPSEQKRQQLKCWASPPIYQVQVKTLKHDFTPSVLVTQTLTNGRTRHC